MACQSVGMFVRSSTFAFAYLIAGFINALLYFGELVAAFLSQVIGKLFSSLTVGWDATRRKSFDEAVAITVAPYMPVLVAKRQKLLRADDYGVIRNERWSKELGYFMGKVLLPKLGRYRAYAERNVAHAALLLDDMICAHQRMQQPSNITERRC